MNVQKRVRRTYDQVKSLHGWCKEVADAISKSTESTNRTEEIGRKYLTNVPPFSKVDDLTLGKGIAVYKDIACNWTMKFCSGVCSPNDAKKNIVDTMDAISFIFDQAKERVVTKITEFCNFCEDIVNTLKQVTESTNFREEVGKYLRESNLPESINFFDDEYGKIKNIIRKCCTGEIETEEAIKSMDCMICSCNALKENVTSLKIE